MINKIKWINNKYYLNKKFSYCTCSLGRGRHFVDLRRSKILILGSLPPADSSSTRLRRKYLDIFTAQHRLDVKLKFARPFPVVLLQIRNLIKHEVDNIAKYIFSSKQRVFCFTAILKGEWVLPLRSTPRLLKNMFRE